MQKSDFIRAVAARSGLPQRTIRIAVEAALDEITAALRRGEPVTLTGFGTFRASERRERKGIHPHTRQPIRIPQRRTPTFSAGTDLTKAVREEAVDPV